MKHYFILLLFVFSLGTTIVVGQEAKASSVARPFQESIEIIGFEKRLKDKTETLLLRNNTTQLVTRIKLKIEYLTPRKEMISYREIIIDGEILPQSTKQFQTESFDKNQLYYYINSTIPGKHTGYPFYIATKLLRYDIAITQ